MNYKLAKKLKDAGFPQKAHNTRKSSATTYYKPTLSELIKECGNNIGILGYGDLWEAVSPVRTNAHYDASFITEGKTPKIAVAKLWLKLNEKRTKKVDN